MVIYTSVCLAGFMFILGLLVGVFWIWPILQWIEGLFPTYDQDLAKLDNLTDSHNDPYREACHEIACRWPVAASALWIRTCPFIRQMNLSVAEYQARLEWSLIIWWRTNGVYEIEYLMPNLNLHSHKAR